MSESSKLSAIDSLKEEFPGIEVPKRKEIVKTEAGETPRLVYTKNKRSQANNSTNNVVTIKDNLRDIKYTMSVSIGVNGGKDSDLSTINDQELYRLQLLVDEFVSKIHEVL